MVPPTGDEEPHIHEEADVEAFWDAFLTDLYESGGSEVPMNGECHVEEVFGEEFFSKWKFLSTKDIPNVSITKDRTDGFNLSTAKEEMTEVSKRIIAALHGKEPTRANVFQLFISPYVPVLLSAMKANTELADSLTFDDVSKFIRTLSVLSFYRETPSNFFSREFEEAFPTAVDHDCELFRTCLRALSKGEGSRSSSSTANRWKEPFKEDPLIRKAERVCSTINSELCFVKDVTIISTDDDQYRLSSTKADDIGLVRVNIPNKSLGPVCIVHTTYHQWISIYFLSSGFDKCCEPLHEYHNGLAIIGSCRELPGYCQDSDDTALCRDSSFSSQRIKHCGP